MLDRKQIMTCKSDEQRMTARIIFSEFLQSCLVLRSRARQLPVLLRIMVNNLWKDFAEHQKQIYTTGKFNTHSFKCLIIGLS